MKSVTNNQEEYDTVIGLLDDSHHLGIHHLHVFLDSQLVVSQLNKTFQVRDTCLFQKYLHEQRLAKHFNHIKFTHIPRDKNHIVDHIAKQILG